MFYFTPMQPLRAKITLTLWTAMETTELLGIAARGEDSRHQFKEDVTNTNSLAAEMAAFANSGGGRLFLGVSNNETIRRLDLISVNRLR